MRFGLLAQDIVHVSFSGPSKQGRKLSSELRRQKPFDFPTGKGEM